MVLCPIPHQYKLKFMCKERERDATYVHKEFLLRRKCLDPLNLVKRKLHQTFNFNLLLLLF